MTTSKKRKCKLPSCRVEFTPKVASQLYCIPKHGALHRYQRYMRRARKAMEFVNNFNHGQQAQSQEP